MTLHRYANFSSSEIWKLTKKGRGKTEYFGAPALTYIKEKQLELRLGRSLSTETNSKTTNWGTFLEAIAFDKMGLEFSLVSKQRYAHKYVDRWVGMPDILNADLVGDIKCPFTLKAFCEVVDAMSEDNPGEALKSLTGQGETGSHYYWQIVSNAILCDRDVGGLFVYVPYKSELDHIRESAGYYPDQNKVSFIQFANDSDLPYLIEGNHYKNFNACIFEIPKEDKEFLTERVIKAVEML